MRTLSAALLAAQQAVSGNPIIDLMVGTHDYWNRLKSIKHIEKPFGGTAEILLSNADKSITTDLRGSKVTVAYGYKTSITETIRPNAAGDETNLPLANPNVAHYLNVDETSPDGDYVADNDEITGDWHRDLYNLGALSGSGAIYSVKVYARVKAADTPTRSSLKIAIKTGGTAYEGSEKTVTNSYANYTEEWLTNPNTGRAWTVTEVNALQAGITLRNATAPSSLITTLCDQVYVEVSYYEVSKSAPLWVIRQKDVSREGQLLTQLTCIDTWLKLSLQLLFAGGGVLLTASDTIGDFTPGMLVEGVTSGTKARVIRFDKANSYIVVAGVSNGPFQVETVRSVLFPTDVTAVVTSVSNIAGGTSASWREDTTILAILQAITNNLATITLDSSDAIIDDAADAPIYEVKPGINVTEVFAELMGLTKCAARVSGADEAIHIFDITSTPVSADYTYDTSHVFKVDIRDISEVLPNRVTVYWAEPTATTMATYTGTANDTDAQTRMGGSPTGIITRLEQFQVSSDAKALAVANSILFRIQKEAAVGQLLAKMNCGQELFDYIKIVDSRNSITHYGWVGGITRTYTAEASEYTIQVDIGGLFKAEPMPGSPEFPLPVLPPALVPPVNTQGLTPAIPKMLPAYLPAIIDVDFAATDNDTITWGAGTLKCSDGSSFSILSGSLELANTNPYYLYYDTGTDDGVLDNTQTFTSALGAEKILVAFALKNATTTEKATIVPGTGGKLPVIAASAIFVGKLSAITADMGLLTAGEIRVGTGTLGSNFTGWRLWTETSIGRIGGYLNDVFTWYTDTSGNMSIIGDTLGLRPSDGGTEIAYFYTDDTGDLYALPYTNKFFHVLGDFSIGSTQKLGLGLATGADSYLEWMTAGGTRNHTFRPETNQKGYLGDTTKEWLGGFFKYLGDATHPVTALYVGQNYTYISGSSNDMDFFAQNTAGNGSILALSILNGDIPEFYFANKSALAHARFSTTLTPTAISDNRGKFYYVEGGAGVADVIYCIMKKTDNTYAAIAVATAP